MVRILALYGIIFYFHLNFKILKMRLQMFLHNYTKYMYILVNKLCLRVQC